MVEQAYIDEILETRKARDQRMKTNPQSWFALVGLFPLKEGENTFGAAESNPICLPGSKQMQCGAFVLKNGEVFLDASVDSGITLNGQPPESRALNTDHVDQPDLIQSESLTMMVLLRGQGHYLRVWDSQSPALINFSGLDYYPIDPEYRIRGKFIQYEPARMIQVLDAIGGTHESALVGEVRFSVGEVDCTLVAEGDEEDILISFVDQTSKDATYPGGRFISMQKPKGDTLILDFNRALNWPCAYTDFATCPIPPVENHLPVRIEAGERRYRK